MQFTITMSLDTPLFLDGNAPAEIARILGNISAGIKHTDELVSGEVRDLNNVCVGYILAPDMITIKRKEVERLERLCGQFVNEEYIEKSSLDPVLRNH